MRPADYEIKDNNNGYGHEKAFVDLIEKYGTLHEAQLLPRSFGDGSLVKGQTDPKAVKQLVESLPTAIRGVDVGQGLADQGADPPQAARPETGAENLQGDRVQGRAARAEHVHRRRGRRRVGRR